jgi:beta-galactosidase
MGILVMDEAFDEWKSNKTSHGYGRFFDAWSERDLVGMLQRDRNHPCIILWSIGNEINEQGAQNAYEMSKRLADICHREDPTRPVTSACNNPWAALMTGYAKPLDVLGINYNIGSYLDKSGKDLVASETASALSTRGEYNLVSSNGKVEIRRELNHQCTSYDLDCPPWGHTAETSLKALKDSPWVAGEFVWTGFDYIGEPTPYHWPSRSSYFGIIDLAGFPKDRFYLYQSRWTDKPMVHLLPHWNWPGFEGQAIPVWAFTNAESVELFLNGKSLGIQDGKTAKNLHLEWKVPYQPGTLKAVARTGGKEVAVDTISTAGQPAKLVLRPDRKQIQAGGQDLSFVEVRILDAEGRLCPMADHKVTFRVQGPGRIAGVDNGDPTNHESFQAQAHKAFHGLALVVIQSTGKEGEIGLTASAPELAEATTAISVSRSRFTDVLWDANDPRK